MSAMVSRSISARMSLTLSSGVISAPAPPMRVFTQPGLSTTQQIAARLRFDREAVPRHVQRRLGRAVGHPAAAILGDAAHAARDRDHLAAVRHARQQRLAEQVGSDGVDHHHRLPCARIIGAFGLFGSLVPALAMNRSSGRRSLGKAMTASASREVERLDPDAERFELGLERRAVAITCQPSAEYCRANSRPIPRLAPVMRTVGMFLRMPQRLRQAEATLRRSTSTVELAADRVASNSTVDRSVRTSPELLTRPSAGLYGEGRANDRRLGFERRSSRHVEIHPGAIAAPSRRCTRPRSAMPLEIATLTAPYDGSAANSG